jgi:hypothetical protein
VAILGYILSVLSSATIYPKGNCCKAKVATAESVTEKE